MVTGKKTNGDRGKKTSDQVQTQDLCSIVEFQPFEPPVLVANLHPQHPYASVKSAQLIQQVTPAHKHLLNIEQKYVAESSMT